MNTYQLHVHVVCQKEAVVLNRLLWYFLCRHIVTLLRSLLIVIMKRAKGQHDKAQLSRRSQ